MNIGDKLDINDHAQAAMIMRNLLKDELAVVGIFHAKHLRDGKVIWENEFPNLVVNVGKNYLLESGLKTAPTITGPYMGLVSATPTIAAGDTMASHAGWTEVGGANAPAYSGNRQVAAFASASAGSIALSANLTYTFTSTGNVGGAFIVLNTGAVATKDNTAGTLFSAGAFTTGNRNGIQINDQLVIGYSCSI